MPLPLTLMLSVSSKLPWIALVVSVLALSFSLYQYWRTEWSPFNLTVMPPVITQTNETWPSLIIDMIVSNSGAHQGVISDVTLRLRSKGNDTGIALHAQKSLNRDAPLGTLPLDPEKTSSAVFLPILVGRNETQAFRLYCAPWVTDLPRLSEALILQTDQIELDLLVNGIVRPRLFCLGYGDYREKFKGGGQIVIPPTGFGPRWYREESPAVIAG